MFEKIAEQVKNAKSVIIFPHISMDGDSVACAKALYLALSAMGKNVVILADEGVPDHVSFLGGPEFIVYSKYITDLFIMRYTAHLGTSAPSDFAYDLAIAVDCSDAGRIENRIDIWAKANTTVCIDHHPGNDDFVDYIVRDEKASAAALLVYKFLKESGYKITKEIAEAIYTGIVTDTGAFKYSNADAETLKVAAELYEYGIDHALLCSRIYDNKPLKQLQIESYALVNTKFFCDKKIAISIIPCSYWNSLDVPYSYTESSIDIVRSIQGTEIAIVLKEKSPNVFKASMRAKTYANVQQIAEKLGGGGHEKAAACTLEMSAEEAIALVAKEAESAL